MTTPPVCTIQWPEIHLLCQRLADKVRPHGPFTGLIAVTRGGLAPALLLAQILDVRRIETVGVQSYTHQTAGSVAITKDPSPAVGQGLGWLVVDDLTDSGGTLRILRNLLPQARFAALYAKPQGRPLLDDYVTDVEQDLWLDFPWEQPASSSGT